MIAMEHNTLGTIVVFRNIAPLFTLLIERMFRVPMQVRASRQCALRLPCHARARVHLDGARVRMDCVL